MIIFNPKKKRPKRLFLLTCIAILLNILECQYGMGLWRLSMQAFHSRTVRQESLSELLASHAWLHKGSSYLQSIRKFKLLAYLFISFYPRANSIKHTKYRYQTLNKLLKRCISWSWYEKVQDEISVCSLLRTKTRGKKILKQLSRTLRALKIPPFFSLLRSTNEKSGKFK